MAQGIVYTLGIIIAILLLLIFLRSILLRRQRLAIATLPHPPHTPPLHPVPTPPRDLGIDVVRPEPAVINPHLVRAHRQPHYEQLPLYEAPPPKYDMVPKDVDLERGVGGAHGGDFGESSTSASAPPEYTPAGAPGVAPANTPAAAQRGLFRVDVRRAWSGFGR